MTTAFLVYILIGQSFDLLSYRFGGHRVPLANELIVSLIATIAWPLILFHAINKR